MRRMEKLEDLAFRTLTFTKKDLENFDTKEKIIDFLKSFV